MTEHPFRGPEGLLRRLLESERAQDPSPLAQADPTNVAEIVRELSLVDPEGVLRPIPMQSIEISPGAIDGLPSLVAAFDSIQRVLLVTDEVPIQGQEGPVKEKVYHLLKEQFPVRWLVLREGDGGDLRATEGHGAAIVQALQSHDCVVGIGGGTVADLCKFALHLSGSTSPLILVQTMLSVAAFSDGLSVILRNGVKRTITTRYPTALIIDLNVVTRAPRERNLSGYGDLMATWTAPADWLLAHSLAMGTNYHRAPETLLRRQSLELLLQSPRLGAGDEESLLLLAKVLTLSGFTMGIAGESSPASGSEHTVSHLLDMVAEARGEASAFHGTQVGVCTLVMSCVWDEFLNTWDPSSIDAEECFPEESAMEARVLEAFHGLDGKGDLEQECWRDYRKKLAIWNSNRDRTRAFLGNWPTLKNQFRKKVLPPELLVECMQQAGVPTRFSQLCPSVPRSTAFWAIKNCHLYRSRFTLVDLLFFTGHWNDLFIERALARLKGLGAGYGEI